MFYRLLRRTIFTEFYRQSTLQYRIISKCEYLYNNINVFKRCIVNIIFSKYRHSSVFSSTNSLAARLLTVFE